MVRIIAFGFVAFLSGCVTLHDTVYRNDIQEAKAQLASGRDVNKPNDWGDTPLHTAASTCNEPMVRLFLDNNANINATNRFGGTPLTNAIMHAAGNVNLVSRIPQYKNIYLKNAQSCIAITQLLIERGVDINYSNTVGDTPLTTAIWNGNLKAARLLVEAAANVNQVNNRGYTPLLLLANKPKEKPGTVAGAAPAPVKADSQAEQILLADPANEVELAKLMITKGARLDAADNETRSNALIHASTTGRTELAKFLIEKGLDVNSINATGGTPLVFAAKDGNLELVRALMDKGAKVNHITQTGNTPLTWAALGGHTEVVKLLLAKGADTTPRNKDGKSALDLARENNRTDVFVLLSGAPRQGETLSPTLAAELKKILARKDDAALRKFIDSNPSAVNSIEDVTVRLMYTGPAELRIVDVEQLVNTKTKDALVIAQINSAGGPYKKFTSGEIGILKKHGISDEVIAAMLNITTEYNKEQKRKAEQQAMMGMKQAPAASNQAQQVQMGQQQPAKVAENNTPADCLKLVAAIKACDQAGGFLAMGCKMAAKSKFDCPIPVETLMR